MLRHSSISNFLDCFDGERRSADAIILKKMLKLLKL